jgi:hypothetical protein
MGKALDVLTSSSIRCYRSCQRKYKHRYVDKREGLEKSGALRFGTATHLALEAIWKTKQRKGEQEEALRAGLAAIDGLSDPYDVARCRAMVTGYVQRWYPMDIEILAVEVEYKDKVLNPETMSRSRTWVHRGKIDAIVRVGEGTFIMEHKTSSEDIGAGSAYWSKLRVDDQISNYLRGATVLGFEPQGCIYDVLKKPKLRPRKATAMEKRKYKADGSLYGNQRKEDETPPEFFHRVMEAIAESPEAYYRQATVVRFGKEIEAANLDLWHTGKQIADSKKNDRWPRNPNSCFLFNKECEYFPVCSGEDSIDGTQYKDRVEHQELSS